MSSITFDRATRQYPGAPQPAVDVLDLEIADGELFARMIDAAQKYVVSAPRTGSIGTRSSCAGIWGRPFRNNSA